MLRKIIYSGDGRKKFILSSFPDIIDQAKVFEQTCAMISAVIYTADETKRMSNMGTPDCVEFPIIKIKNNNLTLFNIDALFQKEYKLKTMTQWDDQKWQEMVGGKKTDWSIVVG